MHNFISIEPIKHEGLMPSMDIFADLDKTVTVVFTGKNGGDYDKRAAAEQGLKEGVILTVSNIEVGSWNSEVYFEEIPGVSFNSVMFLELENYLALQ